MSYLTNLFEQHSLLVFFSALLLFHLARYFVFVGGGYLMLYVHTPKHINKIQPKMPDKKQMIMEFKSSMRSLVIFTLVGCTMYWGYQHGYSQIYLNFDQHGLFYAIFSFIVLVIIHDTYFYWAHRLMHHRKLFRYTHKTHHLSTNPSPFAVYLYSPVEAVVDFLDLTIISFLMPLHPTVIVAFFLFTLLINVMAHAGYETSPAGFTTSPWTRWLHTPTHHNLHHTDPRSNFGIYFSFWDNFMKTTNPKYHEKFELVAVKKTKSNPSH